jgi:uncharacterized membrane protein
MIDEDRLKLIEHRLSWVGTMLISIIGIGFMFIVTEVGSAKEWLGETMSSIIGVVGMFVIIVYLSRKFDNPS